VPVPVELILFGAVLAVVGWVGVLVIGRLRRLDRAAMDRADKEALAAARTAAALDARGTLPERPVEVDSAAAVEPRAESIPCLVCDGPRHVLQHATETLAGHRLRRLTMRCGSCGRHGDLYFRIQVAGPPD
jgi:hypothetical protein